MAQLTEEPQCAGRPGLSVHSLGCTQMLALCSPLLDSSCVGAGVQTDAVNVVQ